MEVKNNALSLYEETEIEDGFSVLKFNNESQEPQRVTREVNSSFIQFHFCAKGSAVFKFNDGNYKLPLQEENSLLLYNPQRDLPMNLELNPNSWMVSVVMTIRKFHSLFSKEADYIPFLSAENKDKNRIEVDRSNIKIQKKQGGSIADTEQVSGIIMDKEPVHTDMPRNVQNASVALIDAPLEIKKTEIESKIQINDPSQIQAFLDQEESTIKKKCLPLNLFLNISQFLSSLGT